MIATATTLRALAALAAAAAVAVAAGAVTLGSPGRARSVAFAPLRHLRRLPTPPAARRAIADASLAVDAHSAFWGWIGAVVCTVASAPILSTGPLVVAVTVAAPPVAVFALRGRRAARRKRQLPDALDTVASSLRSGRSVAGAIAALADGAGTLNAELRPVVVRAESGRPLAAVLADWADDSDADTRLAGAALATAAELGGPGATALETTAQSLRDRAEADGLVEALSVQARLSAWLLTLAPVAFAGVMTGIDPRAGQFLFNTPIGWLCLAAGLGLDVLGGFWMHTMVRKTR